MFEPAVPGGFCLRVDRTTLTRCGCPATLQAFRPALGGNVSDFARPDDLLESVKDSRIPRLKG
jgi:hypothetical protein